MKSNSLFNVHRMWDRKRFVNEGGSYWLGKYRKQLLVCFVAYVIFSFTVLAVLPFNISVPIFAGAGILCIALLQYGQNRAGKSFFERVKGKKQPIDIDRELEDAFKDD